MSQQLARWERRGSGALILVVLIALAIILFLYFGGGKGSYMNQVKQTRQKGRDTAVAISFDQFNMLIGMYHQRNGKYPRSVEEMEDDAPSFRDPWGGPVTFTIEESKGRGPAQVRYHSPGPDQTDGTPDDINKTETLPPL
jgi:hypothetical protein